MGEYWVSFSQQLNYLIVETLHLDLLYRFIIMSCLCCDIGANNAALSVKSAFYVMVHRCQDVKNFKMSPINRLGQPQLIKKIMAHKNHTHAYTIYRREEFICILFQETSHPKREHET